MASGGAVGEALTFAHHIHPYTVALLSAIPEPTVHNKRKRILLSGELSSPINPAARCRFANRCRYCTEECMQKNAPELREIRKGHLVACHRAEELMAGTAVPNDDQA